MVWGHSTAVCPLTVMQDLFEFVEVVKFMTSVRLLRFESRSSVVDGALLGLWCILRCLSAHRVSKERTSLTVLHHQSFLISKVFVPKELFTLDVLAC